MKYPYELRLKIAMEFFSDLHIGGSELARKYNVPKKSVYRWIRLYEIHGAEGLIKPPRRYSGEFKIHVIEYMHVNALSLTETANHFGIQTHNTISKWERIYYDEGPQALLEERRGRKPMGNKKITQPKKTTNENEDLLAEIQRLRMENEYLKKLNALVLEREKSEQKKK